jgi:hypothetical protein
MSAVKVIFKRSSILGKRPTNANLEPGELALNTNSVDPGVYLEVNDGSVVKVGPTSVLPQPPIDTPEKGELWYNTVERTLNIGTLEGAKKQWQTISAPYLGGGGFMVFVAPEFPYATDSLLNDGQTLPFQTLTRAILELSKISIQNLLKNYSFNGEGSRYTIYVAPSRITANNAPGTTVENFSVNFSANPYKDVTIDELTQFNSPTGGIILPRGMSIVGMDLRKCVIHPTYVPTYLNPTVPAGTANQPLSAILKWSGNAYLNNFTVADKLTFREIYSATETSESEPQAIFTTLRPHGLSFNEEVHVDYTPTVNQTLNRPGYKVTFDDGTYYAAPIDTFRFYLSPLPISTSTVSLANFVSVNNLPQFLNDKTPKLLVSNTLKSAHRLSFIRNASFNELGDYYTKVQKAFPEYFGGQVTAGKSLVTEGEYVIVAPTNGTYPNNLDTNSTANSSPYANQLTLRSQYGMAFGDFDGKIVSGFRSVLLNQCTAVSLQNDPSAYEVYGLFTTPDGRSEQRWYTLTEAAWLTLPPAVRPPQATDVPTQDQLQLLNQTSIDKIRFHYDTLKSTDNLSYGIVNIDEDFRHFGFRAIDSSYIQGVELFTIGPAIGVWALNGGTISLTNSTSNFGSIAFKSEGFRGIGTLNGAFPNSQNFFFEGVQVPLSLTNKQVESDENKQIFPLGGKIVRVYKDLAEPGIQLIELTSDFSPCYLLPYSLKPGSALWVASGICSYRAFFATDGGPTVITGLNVSGNAILRLRASDSSIPYTDILEVEFGVPYIRRFRDPRDTFERAYSFSLSSTSFQTIAPPIGSAMRLNQSLNNVASVLPNLKPNVQLDPGQFGGWGRVFTVDDVLAASQATSPRFNYVIGDVVQDTEYFVIATTTDYSRPWIQNYDNAVGSYVTYANLNWYTAENNIWDSVYYDVSFSPTVGPKKLAPIETCSPFVATSVLEKQEVVADAYQSKFSPDPLRDLYPEQTYFRGATIPYTESSPQDYYDDDDGSEGLGILLTDVPLGFQTRLTELPVVIQTEQLPSMTPAPGVRYRPEIVRFSVQQPRAIVNPKQAVSIVRFVKGAGATEQQEYFRVIKLNSDSVEAIRLNELNSYYPSATNSTWTINTKVEACIMNTVPNTEIYDPQWSNSRRSVTRFYELMGYNPELITPYLKPQWWGERVIPIASLPLSPSATGYAATTSRWPIEFNQSSSIQASLHTWVQTGYQNYSRGLPEFQTVNISRKQAVDFLASTLWGGRLSVVGTADNGEQVLLGAQRQALTARYYGTNPNDLNLDTQQIYNPFPTVEFPAPVLVFAADDISDQFDGAQSVFTLTSGGLVVPPSQLVTASVLTQLGAVVQTPAVFVAGAWINGGFWITPDTSEINFASPPLPETTCEIRVITSDDDEKTLTVVQYTLDSPTGEFDGVTNNWGLTPANISTKGMEITTENTLVFLGGTEQLPTNAYTITVTSAGKVSIAFTNPPPASTDYDIRTITSGSYYALQKTFPVQVYSFDDIAPLFNSVRTEFPLELGGVPVDSTVVGADNLFVSLGGAIQLPPQRQFDPVTGVQTFIPGAYTVQDGKIIFVFPPASGTTCNMRYFGEREFINCPLPNGLSSDFMKWGPGVLLSLEGALEALDSGIIGN